MAVPAGADIALYDSPNKVSEFRILVGLDYPALLAEFSSDFDDDDGLDRRDWSYSQYGGPPIIDGFMLRLQQFGGPIRQWVQTREHCFPDDPTADVEIHFRAAFPQDDPVFSQVITVGHAGESPFGPDNEPFRIVQHGSMRYREIGADDIGKLFFSYAGNLPAASPSMTNDGLLHNYDVNWSAGVLTILVDEVEIFSDEGPRPHYVRLGMEMPPEDYAVATAGRTAAVLTPANAYTHILNGGSEGVPTPMDVIVVDTVTIGGDFDTRTYPAWTFANVGGGQSDSLDGERVESDDVGEMAKLPMRQLVAFENPQGLSLEQISDTLTVTLAAPNASAPEEPPLFVTDRLVGRYITLMTRVYPDAVGSVPEDGTWRQQFVGVINRKLVRGDTVTLEARDFLTDRLDTFIPRGYLNVAGAPGVRPNGNDGAYTSGLLLSGPDIDGLPGSILADLIDVADAISGAPFASDYELRLLDHKPVALSTGGQSLLPTFQEIVDRCGLHWWRKFMGEDEGSGKHMVAARTLTGTPGYTFRGQDAGNSNINFPPGVTLDEGRQDGVGQINMRQDSPAIRSWQGSPFEFIQTRGIFPSGGVYPANDRTWDDSSALLMGFGLGTLNVFNDASDTPRQGGIPYSRYKAANAERRKFEWEVVGHDWIEPTDIVAIEDRRTLLDGTEPIVIVNRLLSWSATDGHLRTRVQGVTGDYLNAIRRTI